MNNFLKRIKGLNFRFITLSIFILSTIKIGYSVVAEEIEPPHTHYYYIGAGVFFIGIIIFLCYHKSKLVNNLQENMQVQENLIRVSKDVLSIWSANWTLTQFNAAFEKILDCEREFLLNKNFIELIDPEEKEKFVLMKNNLKTQKTVTFEIKMISKNNENRWISWYCYFDEETMSIYAAGRDITNENLFLEKLQHSEEKARKQFKSIPVPTYTWKRSGEEYVLTDYNDIVYQMTDGKVKQILGIKASDLLKDNYQVLRDMDFCYITRKPIRKEIEFYVEESKEKKFYITSYAFVPPDSVMIHMEDTTFKKSLELEMRYNEQKYKALFNSSSDAILLVDLSGRIIDCNQACNNMFDYKEDEIKEMWIHQLFEVDHNKTEDQSIITEIEELITRLFGLDVVDGFVEVNCKKNHDTIFSAETQAQFFSLKDQRMVLLYIRDIRDRKKMEIALKDREARLTAAFENLPMDFWMTDNHLVFNMQSKFSIDLWGKLINQPISDIEIPNEIKQQWISECNKAKMGEVIIHDVCYQHQEQEKTFIQIVAPIYDDNKVSGLLGANIDITEKKLQEEELKRYSLDLEKVNQELKSFAYIVSHDLKAPLRAINTLVEWLTNDYKDAFDDEGKNMLNLLTNRTKRMHDLIDGILKYSRVGRMDVPLENVFFYELVQSVVNILVIPESIDIIIDPQLPIVKTPRIYMEQVFQNLISNSVKFMDKEEGIIEIGYTDLNTHYEFFVKDNGPGIDPKYYDKVFQIFQTLQAKDTYESTGIGLSIVKKIIENYGGEVWIESILSQGTTIKFTIVK